MAKELATKYDPSEFEDKIYDFWQENKYFHAEPDETKTPLFAVVGTVDLGDEGTHGMADQDFRKAGMLGDGDVSHLVHIFDDDLVGTLRALTDVAKVLLFAHRGLSVTDMVFAVDGITDFGKMLCKAVETVDMFTDTVGDEGDRFGLDSVIDPGA